MQITRREFLGLGIGAGTAVQSVAAGWVGGVVGTLGQVLLPTLGDLESINNQSTDGSGLKYIDFHPSGDYTHIGVTHSAALWTESDYSALEQHFRDSYRKGEENILILEATPEIFALPDNKYMSLDTDALEYFQHVGNMALNLGYKVAVGDWRSVRQNIKSDQITNAALIGASSYLPIRTMNQAAMDMLAVSDVTPLTMEDADYTRLSRRKFLLMGALSSITGGLALGRIGVLNVFRQLAQNQTTDSKNHNYESDLTSFQGYTDLFFARSVEYFHKYAQNIQLLTGCAHKPVDQLYTQLKLDPSGFSLEQLLVATRDMTTERKLAVFGLADDEVQLLTEANLV